MEKEHIEREFARINAAGGALMDYGLSRGDIVGVMIGFIIEIGRTDELTAYFADYLNEAVKMGHAKKPTLQS